MLVVFCKMLHDIVVSGLFVEATLSSIWLLALLCTHYVSIYSTVDSEKQEDKKKKKKQEYRKRKRSVSGWAVKKVKLVGNMSADKFLERPHTRCSWHYSEKMLRKNRIIQSFRNRFASQIKVQRA